MADVCLLGCGGMMPLPGRWLTSLLFRHNGRMILVDCGEGTQIPVKLAGWGFRPIDFICLTHYHADHTAGLPGLLLTMGNSGRTEPLTIFGPPGLAQVVRGLTVIAPQLPFELVLRELPADRPSQVSAGEVQIASLPADHGFPCLTYSFEIPRPGRFDPQKADRAGVPQRLWNRLQHGETLRTDDGRAVKPEDVLGPPRKGLKVGYCTDTRPFEALSRFLAGCDLLICEGLYGDSALAQKALEKGHMVFAQAAQTALASGSRELWLTHFSPAMPSPGEYIPQAAAVFANTRVGTDLLKKTLLFED